MDIGIYLSGSIMKGKNDFPEKTYWSERDIWTLKDELGSKFKVCILNPSERGDDLKDTRASFGRDLLQILISDVVIVDGRKKKGIGVGAEIAYAKLNGIPVFVVSPQKSHYIKTNFEYLGQYVGDWIHPFIKELSDGVFSSIKSVALYIKKNYPFEDLQIKDEDCFTKSIMHYTESQLSRDDVMKRCIKNQKNTMKQRKLEPDLEYMMEKVLRSN